MVARRKSARRHRLAKRWLAGCARYVASSFHVIARMGVVMTEDTFENLCAEVDARKSNGSKSYNAKAEQAERQTLEQVHAVFRKWLGDDYDIGALNAVL